MHECGTLGMAQLHAIQLITSQSSSITISNSVLNTNCSIFAFFETEDSTPFEFYSSSISNVASALTPLSNGPIKLNISDSTLLGYGFGTSYRFDSSGEVSFQNTLGILVGGFVRYGSLNYISDDSISPKLGGGPLIMPQSMDATVIFLGDAKMTHSGPDRSQLQYRFGGVTNMSSSSGLCQISIPSLFASEFRTNCNLSLMNNSSIEGSSPTTGLYAHDTLDLNGVASYTGIIDLSSTKTLNVYTPLRPTSMDPALSSKGPNTLTIRGIPERIHIAWRGEVAPQYNESFLLTALSPTYRRYSHSALKLFQETFTPSTYPCEWRVQPPRCSTLSILLLVSFPPLPFRLTALPLPPISNADLMEDGFQREISLLLVP